MIVYSLIWEIIVNGNVAQRELLGLYASHAGVLAAARLHAAGEGFSIQEPGPLGMDERVQALRATSGRWPYVWGYRIRRWTVEV